jgi:aryl-phospho-beta-D-glucosidase BglC (GH1 family)
MTRLSRCLIATMLWAVVSSAAGQESGEDPLPALPAADASNLPPWKGFNLLEKFQRDRDAPFREEDFQRIHQLGFNFVRLPMDYRIWIEDGDWTRFREQPLREIDQAVQWGGKYSIHVSLNFHRAPGYTVARPAEAKSLWTDPEAQRVCALHWAMFARRYRGIPNDRLSFNLFNEPAGVDPQVYANVVRPIVAAIRAEDPDRLIISDGLQWGHHPAMELADLGLAQATRGYVPSDVTHYRASWVSGSDRFPTPRWPRMQAYGTLVAPHKPDLQPESKRPLVIHGSFDRPATLRVRVMVVSDRATLVARADGEPIWQHQFVCGPGEGEWKKAEFRPQWNIYQNTYDRDYTLQIPAGTERVELAVVAGDWLQISEIGLQRAEAAEDSLTLRQGWDRPPAEITYRPAAAGSPFVGQEMEDRQWLWDTMIVPWKEAQDRGIGVMVGEFGCHNRTPHDVVLAWMEDCLENWQRAGWGWALWNFRGSFGILDSGRSDVDYEEFHGHQLDRKMLDLLQRYR